MTRSLDHRRASEPRISIGRANDDRWSGDCARVVFRREGTVLCFLGDVTGHDARAASLAQELEVRVSVRAHQMTPGALLAELNSDLEAAWASEMFVSAVCLTFDARRARGTIAVAGQLPPLVKGAWSTSAIDVAAGPPLGVFAGEHYPERGFGLSPGELLVAVTDGITDPLASAIDLLGMTALARIVERAPAEPNEVCASLLRAAGRSGVGDDATVLAVAAPPRRPVASSPVAFGFQRLAM